ncbi:OTU domain-containing protein 5-A, partial [Aplysia californica]
MKDAVKSSENFHIEQTMLADKLRETDWEVTQDSIEEQVARESYLHWLREQEKSTKRSKARTASATCSSAGEGSHVNPLEAGPVRSPRQLRSGNSSPLHPDDHFVSLPGSSKSPRLSPPQSVAPVSGELGSAATGGQAFNETASIMDHLPPAFYGVSDWAEEDILAQVMAQSQQEYLDNLKKKAAPSTGPPSVYHP